MNIKVAVNFDEVFSNYTFNIPYFKGNCLKTLGILSMTKNKKLQIAGGGGGGG